jgi:two-component system, OmpR family, phosphate regulon sensor histidine kinase PhoR
MKASRFIRIFSVFGILMLLVLQYVWFRNSYVIMEHDIIERSLQSLKTSIEVDLHNRIEGVFEETLISNDKSKPVEGKVMSKGNVKQSDDLNYFLQNAVASMGRPCKAEQLDSVFRSKVSEAIGFIPTYTLRLVKAKDKDNSKVSKFTFYGKITENQYAEVKLVNPLGSILRQAQMIVGVSILLVIIIGVVLVYLLRSTLLEAKFVTFIREYTHALTHELKTPISGIYMASSQLASGIFEEKPEARKKYYAMCQESSSKLLSTVDRILLVARAEHSKITTNSAPVEVKPFIEKIADTHRSNNFRRKDVELTTSCQPEDLIWNFDSFLMENVLNNLIDNAMKYSDQSVSIAIFAGIVDKKAEIRVKDNGFGIAENELTHIFDNFERGNNVKGKGIDGFGIGLNYVNKVVRAHKGSIKVESKEGVGTEFLIHLPL